MLFIIVRQTGSLTTLFETAKARDHVRQHQYSSATATTSATYCTDTQQ